MSVCGFRSDGINNSLSQGRTMNELSQLQRDDPVIGPVIRALARKTKPDQNELKQFSLHTNRLFALWDQ